MRRNSLVLPPGKKQQKAEKRHKLSQLLSADRRVLSAPRHVEVVEQPEQKLVFCVKIYVGLDAPGSELMTVSCMSVKQQLEVEMRFDEKFAVSIRFKKQNDEERVAYARQQIERGGGYGALANAFRAAFPELEV